MWDLKWCVGDDICAVGHGSIMQGVSSCRQGNFIRNTSCKSLQLQVGCFIRGIVTDACTQIIGQCALYD